MKMRTMPHNIIVDIFIFKALPATTGFVALLFGGGFFGALLMALFIKILLYFFEKEIKQLSLWLRKKLRK